MLAHGESAVVTSPSALPLTSKIGMQFQSLKHDWPTSFSNYAAIGRQTASIKPQHRV
jgi:hypothetical protein